MLGWLFRSALSMLALAALVYSAFFVRLGGHTFYGHVTRVAGTEEARELGSEVGAAVGRVQRDVASRIGNPRHPKGSAAQP